MFPRQQEIETTNDHKKNDAVKRQACLTLFERCLSNQPKYINSNGVVMDDGSNYCKHKLDKCLFNVSHPGLTFHKS